MNEGEGALQNGQYIGLLRSGLSPGIYVQEDRSLRLGVKMRQGQFGKRSAGNGEDICADKRARYMNSSESVVLHVYSRNQWLVFLFEGNSCTKS